MSDIPTIVPYPDILDVEEVPELKDRLVYMIEGYELNGISVVMFYKDGKIGVRCGDFQGNLENPAHVLDSNIAKHLPNLTNLLVKARIPQAQFYFSNDVLVDIRTSLNNMVSPGMLKDLCSNIVPTQNIIDLKPFDDDLKEELHKYDYVILKHSSFKVIVREDVGLPLYAISRGAK
jgi:hypothetical protein